MLKNLPEHPFVKNNPFLIMVVATTILALPLIPPMFYAPYLSDFDKLGRALIVYAGGCAAAYYIADIRKTNEMLRIGLLNMFIATLVSPFLYFGFQAIKEL